MRKNIFKYIFIVSLIIFCFAPVLKAEEDVSISTNNADFISTTNFLGDYWLDAAAAAESGFNYYKYILFNGASAYGGEANALSTCNKYCNSCQKYQMNPEANAFYVCKTYNLKSGYFAVHNVRTPQTIKPVNSTNFPKVTAAFKCRYVKYSDESSVAGQSGLTRAGRYVWVCESNEDCKKTCSGSCIAPLSILGMHPENRDKFYSCPGRKLPNVFVTIDGKEVNADTLPAISDADLKDWVAKTGDGIKAGFKGILIVIGSEGTLTCSGGLGDAIGIIKYVFNFIKIGSVIMLILFSTLDFMKAVTGDAKDMKKATDNSVKRAVVVVVLFILPSLINLILSIIGYSQGVCGL